MKVDVQPDSRLTDASKVRCARVCVLALVMLLSGGASAQQPQAQSGQPLYPVNAKYVNGHAPGYWPTAGSGLTLNLSAGTALCGNSLAQIYYAGGTLTMTASATNYVYLDPTQSCAPAVNATGFAPGQVPVAQVVTGSSSITSVIDLRTWFVGDPPIVDSGGQVVNILSRGAVCSATTDNAAAITAAFTAAAGATVYFPPCSSGYGIGSALHITTAMAGLRLVGAQGDYVAGTGSQELSRIVPIPGLANPIDGLIVSAVGVEISNLQFDGTNDPNPTPPLTSGNEQCVGNGIVLDNAFSLKLTNSSFRYWPCSGMLNADAVFTSGGNNNNMVIAQSMFANNGRYGLEEISQGNNNVVVYRDNYMAVNFLDGLFLSGGQIVLNGGVYEGNNGVGVRLGYGGAISTTVAGPLTGNSSAAQTLTPASMSGIYQYQQAKLDVGLSDQEIITVQCIGTCTYWQPNYSYSLGTQVTDPANHIQKVTTAGTSGSGLLPSSGWNESGGTTADNTVTWTDQGAATTFQAYVFHNHSPSSITMTATSSTSYSNQTVVENPLDIESNKAGNVVFADCESEDFVETLSVAKTPAGCNGYPTWLTNVPGAGSLVLSAPKSPGYYRSLQMHVGMSALPAGMASISATSNGDPNISLGLLGQGLSEIYLGASQKAYVDNSGTATLHTMRMQCDQASAVVSGDWSLSGWGSGASVSSVASGSTDCAGYITITAGSSASANPTTTLTFHDGAWPAAPLGCMVAFRGSNDSNAISHPPYVSNTNTTTMTFTYPLTPVNGDTYTVGWKCP